MKEIRLNELENQAVLEVAQFGKEPPKVFIHSLRYGKTVQVASAIWHQGKQLIALSKKQFEQGTYIYTVEQDGNPVGFGRIIAS